MTVNGAISQLKEIQDSKLLNPILKPYIDKVVETFEDRTGKWLDYDDTEQFTARCSICGNRVDTRFAMNYCGNCGAKMEIQSEFF